MTQSGDFVVKYLMNKTSKMGRPKIMTPCPWCKKEMGARELRDHMPHCEKRPNAKS